MTDATLFRWRTTDTLLWLACGALFYLVTTAHQELAFHAGSYVPVGNDSFYHADRILHAMYTGEFRQFDLRVHAPEGSLVPMAWGYDWLLAKLAYLLQSVFGLAPLPALLFLPSIWGFVNLALLLMLAGQVGLPRIYRAGIALSFVLSPFNMHLHLFGRIDQHFMELTLLLATACSTIYWLQRPARRLGAVLTGLTLAAAPLVNTGLFILQLPVLLTLFLSWLYERPQPRNTTLFAAVLFFSSVLLAIPSEAFRQLRFAFYYHSWFHVYVALCAAAVTVLLQKPRTRARVLGVLALGIALSIPLLREALHGYQWTLGHMPFVADISEAASPLDLPAQRILKNYTAFAWLLPLTFLYCCWQAHRSKEPTHLFFAVLFLVCLPFLLGQMRFHYLGGFLIIMSSALLVHGLSQGSKQEPVIRKFFLAAVVAAMAYPASFLLKTQTPSQYFSALVQAGSTLRPLCQNEPGILLADWTYGHKLLYFSGCPIVANGLIMTPQNLAFLARNEDMLNQTPSSLQEKYPEIRYVFLARAESIFLQVPDAVQRRLNNELTYRLLIRNEAHPAFEKVQETRFRRNGKTQVLARVYRIRPAARAAPLISGPRASTDARQTD